MKWPINLAPFISKFEENTPKKRCSASSGAEWIEKPTRLYGVVHSNIIEHVPSTYMCLTKQTSLFLRDAWESWMWFIALTLLFIVVATFWYSEMKRLKASSQESLIIFEIVWNAKISEHKSLVRKNSKRCMNGIFFHSLFCLFSCSQHMIQVKIAPRQHKLKLISPNKTISK